MSTMELSFAAAIAQFDAAFRASVDRPRFDGSPTDRAVEHGPDTAHASSSCRTDDDEDLRRTSPTPVLPLPCLLPAPLDPTPLSKRPERRGSESPPRSALRHHDGGVVTPSGQQLVSPPLRQSPRCSVSPSAADPGQREEARSRSPSLCGTSADRSDWGLSLATSAADPPLPMAADLSTTSDKHDPVARPVGEIQRASPTVPRRPLPTAVPGGVRLTLGPTCTAALHTDALPWFYGCAPTAAGGLALQIVVADPLDTVVGPEREVLYQSAMAAFSDTPAVVRVAAAARTASRPGATVCIDPLLPQVITELCGGPTAPTATRQPSQPSVFWTPSPRSGDPAVSAPPGAPPGDDRVVPTSAVSLELTVPAALWGSERPWQEEGWATVLATATLRHVALTAAAIAGAADGPTPDEQHLLDRLAARAGVLDTPPAAVALGTASGHPDAEAFEQRRRFRFADGAGRREIQATVPRRPRRATIAGHGTPPVTAAQHPFAPPAAHAAFLRALFDTCAAKRLAAAAAAAPETPLAPVLAYDFGAPLAPQKGHGHAALATVAREMHRGPWLFWGGPHTEHLPPYALLDLLPCTVAPVPSAALGPGRRYCTFTARNACGLHNLELLAHAVLRCPERTAWRLLDVAGAKRGLQAALAAEAAAVSHDSVFSATPSYSASGEATAVRCVELDLLLAPRTRGPVVAPVTGALVLAPGRRAAWARGEDRAGAMAQLKRHLVPVARSVHGPPSPSPPPAGAREERHTACFTLCQGLVPASVLRALGTA